MPECPSGDLFAAIIDSTPEPIIALDTRQRIAFSNRVFQDFVGLSAEECQSTVLWALGDGCWDIAPLRHLVTDTLAHRETVERFVLDHEFPRIGRRVFHINARRLQVGAHKSPCVVLIFHDNTERQRADEARLVALNELRAILYSLGEAVISTDAQGRVALVNPMAERLTGWKAAEAVGLSLREVFHIVDEETRAEAPSPELRVLSGGSGARVVDHVLLVARDGTELPIADSCSPIKGPDGCVAGVVLVFRDRTAERQAHRDQAFLAAMFSSIQDGISVLDRDLNVLRVNAVMDAWYADNVPLVGKKCYEVYHNADRPCPSCPSLRCLHSGQVEVEVVAGLPGSSAEWIELFSYPLVDPETREVTSVVEFVRDITARRRAEEERRKLQDQLSQAQKMEAVGRLAGGVAHDFNNMLSIVKGYAELALKRLDASDPVYDDVHEVVQAADRSTQIVRQLLAFSRQQTISPRVLDLNEILAASMKMVRTLVGEDISVRLIPGADLWNVELDPVQVDQILFFNLAANSRDAIADAGEIVIETSNVVFDSSSDCVDVDAHCGEYVLLAFSDDGCGMDHETLERIFDPFFTTKDAGTGTGLGMATVYGIIKQNRGFVHAYSEPGQGTTVKVYLPRCQEEATETMAAARSESHSGKGKILVVEDMEQILSLCRRVLESAGYETLAASTPQEALKLAANSQAPIDLLLTDVVLPGMNGKDLRTRVQALHPEIRALYMSGYTANVIVHRGILDPDAHFLEKPFSMEQLVTAVRDVLDTSTD